jgi:hypothetical protein
MTGPVMVMKMMINIFETADEKEKSMQIRKTIHDLNNLLAVVQGFIELSKFKISQSDPVHENLEYACKTIEQASLLTQHLSNLC